jgi:serine phosphatase RsbU (regulator of sigma subunit)
MAELVLIVNEIEGHRFPADAHETLIGRSSDVAVSIDDIKVSRRHAKLSKDGVRYFLEDLGSSNGTFLNSKRVTGKVGLQHNDLVSVGNHLLRFEDPAVPDGEMTIMRQTAAAPSNAEIFQQDTARKLRAVLELSHHLAHALDTDTILERLLDQLLVIFPYADRSQAIFPHGAEFAVRASRLRRSGDSGQRGFSRSLVRKVVQQRIAVLAEDARSLESNLSIGGLGIHSLIAVPLQTRSGRIIGVIGVDRFQGTHPFSTEDLHLLTAVVLQASAALDNAALHEELLVKERMDRDLALAREIQDGFLPSEMPTFTAGGVELFGLLHPAQEIAGDFYDCIALDDRHLAFVVADVSGKGMPAALFMATARTLLRESLENLRSPARILARLNDAVSRHNPKFMFVTMLLGVYDTGTGCAVLARAGHPPAVLRTRAGTISEIECPQGRLIGIEAGGDCFSEVTVNLSPGDTLILYTDGLTEAASPDAANMFGVERLLRSIATPASTADLGEWADILRREVELYSGSRCLDDDLTLLLLRRPDATTP